MTVKDYHYFGCIIKVAEAPLTDEEIDLLLTQLTSEEIEKLLEDTDPDDKHMPPSARLVIHSTRVAQDTELAGYPATGYPVNFLPDIRYPVGYQAK